MKPESRPVRVSMRDIAKKVGVSHVTVSLALRGHPRISETTRMQIREVAEKLGYRPDPMLAALAQYRQGKSAKSISAALGWINAWPNPAELRSYKEFDNYWRGAHAAAEKYGYRLEEFQLGPKMSSRRLHQVLSARGIRGLLLPPHVQVSSSAKLPGPLWEDFPWSEYSVVRFGRSLPHPRTHLVTADQVANTMLAYENIHRLGYQRIGLVTDETKIQLSGHFFEGGYLMAQRIAGDDAVRVPVCAIDSGAIFRQGKVITSWIKKHKVDAIFTDIAQVLELLQAEGMKVPEDVGIAVTTVLDAKVDAGIDQHPEEIGRVGFLMLNSLINDGARGIPRIFRQILVEGSWVDGKCLPPRK